MERPQILDHKFFHLLDPVTDYIDSGLFFRQPLKWLYYIIGVCIALAPLYVLYQLVNAFEYLKGSMIFTSLLVWLILAATCVGGGLLWFNRAEKLSTLLPTGSKFVAIPAIANFIRTAGEFVGLFIGIFIPIASIIIMIFASNDYMMSRYLPVSYSLLSVVMMIILGYLIVLISRYFAEMTLAIADIANKTDRIARNTKTMSRNAE